MCISLISTAHPDYPFILLNNRDEFLNRPTARADWWNSPSQHVLGGRDLQRQIRGTWLAITRDGRMANLTNFRDEGVEVSRDKSRGGLVNSYVTTPPHSDSDDESFIRSLVDDFGIQDVGGFTLLFGRLRKPKDGKVTGLGVISNRTESSADTERICTEVDQTNGLSNSHYGDSSWPKVVHGEQLLSQAIKASVSRKDDEDQFFESLFDILSVDTLPRPQHNEPWQSYTRQLRNSIFIPPFGGDDVEKKPAKQIVAANSTSTPDHSSITVGEGAYGTQRQTVILVSTEGEVTFIERSLHDGKDVEPEISDRDRTFKFKIDGWED
ncbi:hypothetical protein LTR86_009394 [Recurvomyces mirabilis]|nr:hypothetical protein LTR86_009394 [Recurvomyces mirabilis]